MNRPELFLLSTELIQACDPADIDASFSDMCELGIANLPYNETDIGMIAQVYQTKNGKIYTTNYVISQQKIDDAELLYTCELKFRYRDGECYQILAKPDCPTCAAGGRLNHKHEWIDLNENLCEMEQYLRESIKFKKILTVLLATKGIVKTRTKDKLAALGIGKAKRDNHRPIYTTTLSLPAALKAEKEAKGASGVTLRPHLRRGHIRRQHYGPKSEFTKMIWIEPCFVNADENFVSERSAYNASVKNMQGNPGNEANV